MTRMARPGPDEYAAYYGKYLDLVPEGDLIAHLEAQAGELEALAAQFGEARGGHRYAPDKWSVKEVLGHITDTERIQAYRLLRIARGDATPLAGFDMDDYVRKGGADARPLADLLGEFKDVRRATLALVRSLGPGDLARRGTANGYGVSASALAHIIAGHVTHHAATLRAKYLP
jgi:hypothetical protein